ncbi:MAG: hypothetical protein ACTSV5_11550 [Promethearchaeota archaeon]
MIDSKDGIITNPLIITFIVVIGIHIILAFFSPIYISNLLIIIIVIFIFNFALTTIIFNLLPISLNFSGRAFNILPSIVLLMFASVTILYNISRPIFNTEVIEISLILTLIVIGCIYIGFALINTAFPKWHRQLNIFVGSFSIILSLINMMVLVSILGFIFLTLLIGVLIAIDKIKLFND